MWRPGIIGIMEYLEFSHNCILVHIQNPVIFTKISKPCVTLEIQNPSIWTILEYLEPQRLKPDTYPEPSQRFKVECFVTVVKNCNYFSKALCLRSLTRL